MSWMDSWARPSANSKVPAPLYLSGENVPYCLTCGRVMNSKKAVRKQNNPVKYCSDRCRSRKPGPLDQKIEQTIVSLLCGEQGSGLETTAAQARMVKGDQRIVVTCDEIESIVFGSRFGPEKTHGRKRNKKSLVIGARDREWKKSVDLQTDGDQTLSSSEDDMDFTNVGGAHIRPLQNVSDVNFSVGGERRKAERIEEDVGDLEKRLQGAKRAEEREMVRRAARRGIVFGFEVFNVEEIGSDQVKRKDKTNAVKNNQENKASLVVRKAEALMHGMVVEPSFAKGNWSIRWRE